MTGHSLTSVTPIMSFVVSCPWEILDRDNARHAAIVGQRESATTQESAATLCAHPPVKLLPIYSVVVGRSKLLAKVSVQ